VISLDTSALVRFLTDDEPAVAERVAAAIDGDEQVHVSALVLLELVHVLRGNPYARWNPDVADVLVDLLTHENIVLTGLDRDIATIAIRTARERSPRHLADALIAAAAHEAGRRELWTTDPSFATDLLPVTQLR
jgi:predicted nucleic acid-binding protein